MDLQTMIFFSEAARTGSFSAAAENLNYAQSNLSSRIKQLEDELGEPLFYRHKRGVSLTAKGELFYQYAQRILQLRDEAVTAVRDMDHPRGKLALGSIEATALHDLPNLLSAYHARYPEVKLSLQTDMNDVFEGEVLKRRLDGAFLAGPVQHPELDSVYLKNDRLVLVGGGKDSSYDADRILREEPLITFPEGSVFRRRLELLLSSLKAFYADRFIIFNSLGAMISNICAGIGFGYLPWTIVEPYLASGAMREYPLEDPYADLEIIFIYRKDHIMDAAFRMFLENLSQGSLEGSDKIGPIDPQESS